jgi:hypothetical protein
LSSPDPDPFTYYYCISASRPASEVLNVNPDCPHAAPSAMYQHPSDGTKLSTPSLSSVAT